MLWFTQHTIADLYSLVCPRVYPLTVRIRRCPGKFSAMPWVFYPPLPYWDSLFLRLLNNGSILPHILTCQREKAALGIPTLSRYP